MKIHKLNYFLLYAKELNIYQVIESFKTKLNFNNETIRKNFSSVNKTSDLIKKSNSLINSINCLEQKNSKPNSNVLHEEDVINQILNDSSNNNNKKKDEDENKIKTCTIVSRSLIESKSKELLCQVKQSFTLQAKITALREICNYMYLYPDSIEILTKENTIKTILQIRNNFNNITIKNLTRQALASLGYAEPVKGLGIRLLSIDGGGTKGLVILEVLRHIEKITGKPIHQCFDLISGVSTGAILATLLGTLHLSIDECESIYKTSSSFMFKSDILSGTSRLLFKHAYYDTQKWENILKELFTDMKLIETSQSENCPKVVLISALMNTSTIQPFAFRNYNLPDKSITYYESTSRCRVWEAVRASAAAPGYFEEFILDDLVHQDGGILINNPASVAIHEAQILWPSEQIQTCISLGSGRYAPNVIREKNLKASPTSLFTKLTRLIDSATDTEGVHRLLQDLLPAGTYFRMNPTLSDYFTIDETRPEKLKQMKIDALMYIRKNEFKMESAARSILQERSYYKRLKDWLKLQYTVRL